MNIPKIPTPTPSIQIKTASGSVNSQRNTEYATRTFPKRKKPYTLGEGYHAINQSLNNPLKPNQNEFGFPLCGSYVAALESDGLTPAAGGGRGD